MRFEDLKNGVSMLMRSAENRAQTFRSVGLSAQAGAEGSFLRRFGGEGNFGCLRSSLESSHLLHEVLVSLYSNPGDELNWGKGVVQDGACEGEVKILKGHVRVRNYSRIMDAAKDYIAGLAAGVATVFIGHPFDTIKVKLQTQNTDAHSQRYRNAIQCTSHILKTEGPKGLYRGATSSFVGVSLESSVLFGAYSQIKASLQGDELLNGKPPLHVVLPAAGLAGAGVGFILCPTELVKCRLQVQAKDMVQAVGQTYYAGPLDCVRKILKNEGINGLFRGGTATVMRETCGNMLFFTTYETTRYHLFTAFGLDSNRAKTSQIDEAASTQSMVANTLLETGIGIITGGLAGVAFWSGVLPFDVAKTRIQTARNLSTSRNPLYHLQLIYKQAGIRGLYAGIGPTLTRAFPANAAAIVAWELTARVLHV